MLVGSRGPSPGVQPSPQAIAEERSALKAQIKKWKADFEASYNRKPWQVSLLFHVNRLEELTPDSLEVLRLLDPPIEVLIVGTGRTLQPLPPATEEWLAAHCIAPELSPTRHACSTFNFMGAEGRQVAAVLFPPGDPFADAAREAGPAAGEMT